MSISERVGRRARWGHPDSGLVFLLEKGRCSDAGCTTVSREDTFSEMSQAQEDTPCQIPLGVGGCLWRNQIQRQEVGGRAPGPVDGGEVLFFSESGISGLRERERESSGDDSGDSCTAA